MIVDHRRTGNDGVETHPPRHAMSGHAPERQPERTLT